MDQGEMGTKGWEREGNPRLLLSPGTDSPLTQFWVMILRSFFSLYLDVKMINYIKNVFTFPLL